jgi:hypothetical protein
MGRPSLKTPELIEAICARLETGEPLTWICRDDGMPSIRTVDSWIASDPEVSASIARAREIGGDAIAADALAIADESSRDTIKGRDGQDICDSEWVSRSRLRVETRLKLLAKWHPKRYGDKIDVTSGGEAIGIAETIMRRREAAKAAQ